MRPVKTASQGERVLVRIPEEEKKKRTQRQFQGPTGEMLTLYLVAPEYEEVNKFDISACFGIVEAVDEKSQLYRPGDLAIIDYLVDADGDYLVYTDQGDKIVSIIGAPSYYDDIYIYTTYGYVSGNAPNQTFKYTGERNSLVWYKGDVRELSLIYGVVRDGQLLPNPYWVFCESKPEKSEIATISGVKAYKINDETYAARKVIYSPDEQLYPVGATILATKGSPVKFQLAGQVFDIVAVTDIWGIEQPELPTEKESTLPEVQR